MCDTKAAPCDQIRKAMCTHSMRSNQEGNAHSLHAISSIPITAVANQESKNQFPVIDIFWCHNHRYRSSVYT